MNTTTPRVFIAATRQNDGKTTASLGLVCDRAQSQIPALGYTVTYAVGNTLLTIWGMVLIMVLSRGQ